MTKEVRVCIMFHLGYVLGYTGSIGDFSAVLSSTQLGDGRTGMGLLGMWERIWGHWWSEGTLLMGLMLEHCMPKTTLL